MGWVRLHSYTLTLLLAASLLISGAYIVSSRTPVSPQQNTLTWGGGAIAPAYPTYATSDASAQQIVQQVVQGNAAQTLSLPALAPAPSSPAQQQAQQPTGSFDYSTFFAQANGNSAASSSAGSSKNASGAIAQAYQFVPSGLIATTAPARRPMTSAQSALYDYGNQVGAEIQAFENLHTNQVQVLKDQAEDRTDQTKAAAVVSLGQGYVSIGNYMQQMQSVPNSISALHSALAQSYITIGAGLQTVAQANGDAAFVQAIENYDKSADTFVHNYGSMAQFFSEQGVTFAPQDPGSVFSFTETGGVSAGL